MAVIYGSWTRKEKLLWLLECPSLYTTWYVNTSFLSCSRCLMFLYISQYSSSMFLHLGVEMSPLENVLLFSKLTRTRQISLLTTRWKWKLTWRFWRGEPRCCCLFVFWKGESCCCCCLFVLFLERQILLLLFVCFVFWEVNPVAVVVCFVFWRGEACCC